MATETYSVTDLDSATTYYYRVSPYNSDGTGDYSNVANATTFFTLDKETSGAIQVETGANFQLEN